MRESSQCRGRVDTHTLIYNAGIAQRVYISISTQVILIAGTILTAGLTHDRIIPNKDPC